MLARKNLTSGWKHTIEPCSKRTQDKFRGEFNARSGRLTRGGVRSSVEKWMPLNGICFSMRQSSSVR